MGGQFSKTNGEAPTNFQRSSNFRYTAETEMSSVSSNSQSCDSTLHGVTDPVTNKIASMVSIRTLSFGSIIEVTGSPLAINPEVVQSIFESKKPKWINQKLFLLVKDYFDKSLLTLNSSDTAIQECLRKVRESQKFLQFALQQFDREEDVVDHKYLVTLEALQGLKAAGNPFTENINLDFLAVHKHQVSMLEKLKHPKKEYDEKLESVQTWKKVSSIVFVSTFAATIIFSAVAIAVAAPRVVAAGAAATSIPIGTIGTWFNSLWKRYENALKGEKELIGSMYTGTYVAIKDLEDIWITVNFLSVEIQTLIGYSDYSALGKEEQVKILLVEIEKKLRVLFERIEVFAKQAERCSQDIRRATKVVLQKLVKHPTN